MNSADLGNLTLLARVAFAIMCFERYTASVYPGTDFRPAAEMMWRITDGSEPLDEAAYRYVDIIPECLFEFETYAQYQANGDTKLTEEQYRLFTGILNKDDPDLDKLMQRIYDIAMEYVYTIVKPGAPETLPYLQEVIDILEFRQIGLPDPALLAAYVFPKSNPRAFRSFNWMGESVDPAELSMFPITRGSGPAAADSAVSEPAEAKPVASEPASAEEIPSASGSAAEESTGYLSPADKYAQDTFSGNFGAGRDSAPDDNSPVDFRTVSVSNYEKNEQLLSEIICGTDGDARIITENGCQWEIDKQEDGCTIVSCVNSAHLREVTVPAVLKGLPVTAVGISAFSNSPETGCRYIEKLILPDTVREIGDNFFMKCGGLREVQMPAALQEIGNRAFCGAEKLESLTIPDSCRVIGDYFCADAVSLRTLSLGAGIEFIGDYTCYNTPRLASVSCEGEIRRLGYGSFWVNNWADSFVARPDSVMLRIGKNGCLLYRYNNRMPPARIFLDESIKYVYDFAFGGDAWRVGDCVRDIYLPGVERIGPQAFRKVPNATVHLSAARLRTVYAEDYEYSAKVLCEPAAVVFDLP